MPEIGERIRGKQIGRDPHRIYVFIQCPDCQINRWVTASTMHDKRLSERRCNPCAMKKWGEQERGEKSVLWRGGTIDEKGYKLIKINPSDFFFPMARSTGYVYEHRLVMAKHLGRNLQPWELVHHKGIRFSDIRNKSDNLEDNLELTTKGSHIIEHSKGYRDGYQKGLIDGRNKQIGELKVEIRLLRWQLKGKDNANL